MRARDKRSFHGVQPAARRLPTDSLSRNMISITTQMKQRPMSDARNFLPLSSAGAGATGTRVGGHLPVIGVPDMAHRTASFPSYRGILR